MPKHAFEFFVVPTYNATRILKNEKAYNSAIFWVIKLNFATEAHFDVLDMFYAFFLNPIF